MLSPIMTFLIHFPVRFFGTILGMIIISICLFRYIKCRSDKNLISKKKGVILWILVNYIILLLFFTVFGRRSWDYYRYNFEAGYSYLAAFLDGNYDLLIQIVANIVIFVPIGIMSSCLFKMCVWGKGLSFGLLISLIIEVLQFVLRRGCCEIDDLISNLIGTMIGCLLISIYRLLTGAKERS